VTFNIDFLMFPPLLERCRRHSAFRLWICSHIWLLCDNVFLVQVDLIVSTFVICLKLLFKFVKNCLNWKVQMWLCTIFVLVGYLFTMQISDVTVMWLV